MKEQTVGILGGMGPEATADLFFKIIKATNAKSDADHLHIIIDDNPKIPSRLDAILHGGISPVPDMVKTVENLQRAGADFVIIGANTAHWFYDDVQSQVDIPILNIIKETVDWTKTEFPNIKKIGLLATTGTVKTQLYENAFKKEKVDIIVPEDEKQNIVMNGILDFKYGGNVEKIRMRFLAIIDELKRQGVEAVILGCTEIPIILNKNIHDSFYIDPNEIIAEAVVKRAKGGI